MPNYRYQRGARAERELLGIFNDNGWAVIRSSGSGVNALSPDVVAIKNKVGIAFECKSWAKSSLSIQPEQFEKIREWEGRSASHTFVAWKVKNRGWLFIKTGEFTKGEKNYNVTMRHAFEINRCIEYVLALADGTDRVQETRQENSA